MLAAATFVFVDHSLVAIIKQRFGGALGAWCSAAWLSSLGYNLALAALGVVIALIWAYDSWLALFAIAPLALAQRSLTAVVAARRLNRVLRERERDLSA